MFMCALKTRLKNLAAGGLGSLVFAMASTGAQAETWVARCHSLQVNFDRTNKSVAMYFVTDAGIFQIAQGSIGFDNGVALRAPLRGNASGFNGGTLTEIGLNR